MKFYIDKNVGFCNGVKRALTLAEEALNGSSPIYCIGDIVHNKTVTAALEEKGLIIVNSVDEIPSGATAIIRAHGEAPETYEQCRLKSIKVIDATCPQVRRVQKLAEKYHSLGYTVVLVGEKTHPEIIGINGWCGNEAIVADGSKMLDISPESKVAVMFQTTFDASKTEKTLQNLALDRVKTLERFNTICYTTIDRQNYAHFAAEIGDLIVVVGDRESSNTKKLYSIAKDSGKDVIWVCDDDLPEVDLSKYKNVCFISGASTPRELVEGVLKRMSDIAKETVEVTEETVANESSATAENTGNKLLDDAMKKIGRDYRPGQKVRCRFVSEDKDGVYVSLAGRKQEAYIPNDQLSLEDDFEAVKSALKEGDELECAVLSNESGKIVLSKKAIDERYKDDELVDGIKAGNQFEVKMLRKGKDCLVGKLGSYTVIVHASQIKLGFVKDLDPYVGKTLRLVANPEKIDDAKKVIYASQKAILLAEKKEKEDAFWNNIEVNEIVEGKVMRFAPFGAFVSVRDFDCLAHTSDLSWEKIKSPEEVLEVGKSYEFVVLALDREKNRVALGYKQLQPKPWELAAEKYAVGSVVTGKVARLMPFGAFVELDKHIDGLLHISNVSWEWLDDINKALKIGDEIEVKVIDFDQENKRITLSRKALLEKPENAPNRE